MWSLHTDNCSSISSIVSFQLTAIQYLLCSINVSSSWTWPCCNMTEDMRLIEFNFVSFWWNFYRISKCLLERLGINHQLDIIACTDSHQQMQNNYDIPHLWLFYFDMFQQTLLTFEQHYLVDIHRISLELTHADNLFRDISNGIFNNRHNIIMILYWLTQTNTWHSVANAPTRIWCHCDWRNSIH